MSGQKTIKKTQTKTTSRRVRPIKSRSTRTRSVSSIKLLSRKMKQKCPKHRTAIFISIAVVIIIILGIFLLFFYTPSLETIQKSVVRIEACDSNDSCSQGSGFAAFDSNLIVTNYHVVEGASKITITTIDEVKGESTDVVAFNAEKDIAILKWNNELQPLWLGSSDNAKVGDKVLAIGNPLNETNVVSEGIISSKTSEHGLMTTAAISPGSSGGALILDSNHKLIGVTYLKKVNGESMNYAIKIEDVAAIYKTNEKNIFHIDSSTMSSCMPTLSDIDADVETLNFVSCSGATGDVYSASVSIFSEVTNPQARFENALKERSDWKAFYDRLSSTAKQSLIENFQNKKTVAFDTTWKFNIWLINETYYYKCQTSSCMVGRYAMGTYPTSYNGDLDLSDFEQL